MTSRIIITADWILPLSSPPVKDAAIIIEGEKITDIGVIDEISAKYSDANKLAHVSLITPGLINAHTHLDLSYIDQAQLPSEFASWIPDLVAKIRTSTTAQQRSAVQRGIDDSISSGVTGIVDIDSHGISLPILKESSVRAISLMEIVAGNVFRWRQIRRELDRRRPQGLTSIGYSPHSPYAVDQKVFRRIHDYIRSNPGLISIHTAESLFEREWLTTGMGPIREMLQILGVRKVKPGMKADSSIKLLYDLQMLGPRTALVHCVDIDSEDIAMIGKTNTSVVVCPRSNERLEVGLPPIGALLKAGINITVGTDSLASSPDLSILNELRYIKKRFPNIDDIDLLKMATKNAAVLMDLEDRLGMIKPGMIADLSLWSSFEKIEFDPLAALLADDSTLKAASVVINGKAI